MCALWGSAISGIRPVREDARREGEDDSDEMGSLAATVAAKVVSWGGVGKPRPGAVANDAGYRPSWAIELPAKCDKRSIELKRRDPISTID